MGNLPLVSIVTPSYNQVRFLEQTILSVLNQDYQRIEYIVIDGGSIDGSVDIIRKYEHQLAYWVSEEDRGQAHAISKGWKRAKGEIIAYLNSDDTYVVPDAVSRAVDALQANPSWGMVYGDCGVIDEASALIGYRPTIPFDMKGLLRLCYYISQPATFFRRSSVEAGGGIDETLYYVMDYDLYLRVGLTYQAGCLPGEHLANYRVHRDAKSASLGVRYVRETEKVISRTLADPRLPFSPNGVAKQAYGVLYFDHAAMLVSCGRQAEARPWLWRAVRLYPGVARMYARNRQFFWVALNVLLGTRGMALGVQVKGKLRQLKNLVTTNAT